MEGTWEPATGGRPSGLFERPRERGRLRDAVATKRSGGIRKSCEIQTRSPAGPATILASMPEKQLPNTVNALAGRDFLRAALSEHSHWLRTVIRHRVGEPQAVDDVMQEVAVAVFRQRAPIRDPQRVAPWLYRIALRQSLMYRRQAGR